MPTPHNAERVVAANRDAARPPAVPSLPLSGTKSRPKPMGGEEATGPSTEGRQQYARFASYVSEAEARREHAAQMKAHIAEKAKGATGVEGAEHLRTIADGLAKVVDPNIDVFQGAMYPPGDYALDAVTNRLAQGRRRVESNSTLIREMASDRFTPVLINRDTGETVSAIDARWTPEYGNRGELEAKVGAIISNLDAALASMSTLPVFHPHIPSTYGMARSLLNTYQSLQIAIRHRGMGAMSFEQMVFKPEDLEAPTPDDWPDLIAPTPGKVIQSMRVALVNNTAARLTREDLKLPPGYTMQRRVTQFRKPDEDPVQSLMGKDGDDDEMKDDTADQKPDEDEKMGDGREPADEVPGKTPPQAARTVENRPEHGVRSSHPTDMTAQGAVLSGARGPVVDIDPASTAADQAANDPRNCRILVALHKKPEEGDYDSPLRPETYEECRDINDAVRAYNAREERIRSIGGTSITCSRLLIDDAQKIPAAAIPDEAMTNLVRKLMFRVLTQTKEYPSNADQSKKGSDDRVRGIPLYSYLDSSGIIAFNIIPMYMREYMKAKAGETSGRILLQTEILDENDEPTELTLQCIMEIARTDNNRMFEFFYSTINSDGSPQFVGVRAAYGFGPDAFNRFRQLTKSQHGPFIQLVQELYIANERKRSVSRHHPQYGWGCATIREFFGYMSDCQVGPAKGQLFLTLLPFAPGSGKNNEWEEVYMNVRMNPKRETLSNTAASSSLLPEGMGSNRMIVFAIDLHMIAAGINPVSFHPRGYYAIKDSIPLACMPIAYFMDTGSLVFNTAFKYIGGPKFGTGPARGKHNRETWPLASFDCPMCGSAFPVGLHMCHACTKPIHYPDGMFYADPENPFQVEYYGSHAPWLNELIERNKLADFALHEYAAIKQLRNFPVSRSLAEDHRQTAFFGVPPIKCIAADTSPKEVELFKKSVRGTIQGAIHLDISIERLVAGITGKEARCGVEDFFESRSISCATTIVKHFGAVFATCREKPLCFYARWSIHCQRAYRLCLSRGYLAPFYTGETINYTVDPEMLEKIRLTHLPLQNANLEMRRHVRLSTEFGALDEFRAKITDTRKYQRYMRVDSESLSALLAKVTLTTCYGIPIKGEPGYISDDENEEIEGAADATGEPKGKGKGDEIISAQAVNWRELDPLGRKFIPHHSDPRFAVIDEGKTADLDGPETPDKKREDFKEFVRDHAYKLKQILDEDKDIEKTFFGLVEGVKDQLPDAKSTDPVSMKVTPDVFEALPDELEEPYNVFDVAGRMRRRRGETPQRRVQTTAQREATIPEAHTIPVPTEDEDEDDSELDRVAHTAPAVPRAGRERLGGIAPEAPPPAPREMPPPSNPPSRKTQRQTGYSAATLRVSGRAPYSDQMKLPMVLRMKTQVPEEDMGNPTIEDLIRMCHAPHTLPVVRKRAANIIIAMGANPDDDTNMKAVRVEAPPPMLRRPAVISGHRRLRDRLSRGRGNIRHHVDKELEKYRGVANMDLAAKAYVTLQPMSPSVSVRITEVAAVEVAKVGRDIWAKADSLAGTGRMAGLVSVSGGRRRFDNPKARSVRDAVGAVRVRYASHPLLGIASLLLGRQWSPDQAEILRKEREVFKAAYLEQLGPRKAGLADEEAWPGNAAVRECVHAVRCPPNADRFHVVVARITNGKVQGVGMSRARGTAGKDFAQKEFVARGTHDRDQHTKAEQTNQRQLGSRTDKSDMRCEREACGRRDAWEAEARSLSLAGALHVEDASNANTSSHEQDKSQHRKIHNKDLVVDMTFMEAEQAHRVDNLEDMEDFVARNCF
ncbi:GABBR2 [Symbiodinium sp. CCMP2592]|nr:GABBR2 [Symbiodinium sp. CCMP2592]